MAPNAMKLYGLVTSMAPNPINLYGSVTAMANRGGPTGGGGSEGPFNGAPNPTLGHVLAVLIGNFNLD